MKQTDLFHLVCTKAYSDEKKKKISGALVMRKFTKEKSLPVQANHFFIFGIAGSIPWHGCGDTFKVRSIIQLHFHLNTVEGCRVCAQSIRRTPIASSLHSGDASFWARMFLIGIVDKAAYYVCPVPSGHHWNGYERNNQECQVQCRKPR